MDDYYSKLEVSDEMDNETLFKEHVVRDSSELETIDSLLKSLFSEDDC